MEWAITIPRGQALEWLEELGKEQMKGPLADVREVVEERFGPWSLTRVYFGQEFCEKALPTRKELTQALEVCQKKGMHFTLVTPYVTEEGLVKVKELLGQLAEQKPSAEVVVNDWGVLQLIAENYPALTPVLGRLLNKVLRDPRMITHLKKLTGKTLERYRKSSVTGAPMEAILDKYGVRRVELDLPPQGLDEQGKRKCELSLYLPFGVITTGRICLMRSWGLDEKQKFMPFLGGCDRKCRFYWLEMTDISRQVRKSKNWSILQKGNTVFYCVQKDFLKQGLESAIKAGVSRVVIQKEPL